MSRVRSKNTRLEMSVRRALWSAGLRYRLHGKAQLGKPDLVMKGKRIAIFVHGCFWHGHPGCPKHRIPKTRVEWWTAKIHRNRARDDEVKRGLTSLGWKVFVIWECEAERPPAPATFVETISDASRLAQAGRV